MRSIAKPQKESSRLRVRFKEDFTADELALIREKLEGWIRQTVPPSGSKQPRRQFVLKSRTSGRA